MLISSLISAIKEKQSCVVVGLDPDVSRIPEHLLEGRHFASAVLEFNKKIIDTCKDNCVAVKPQVAYYEALGVEGIAALNATIKYAKSHGLLVITDAKRGDIPSTAKEYASAYLAKGGDFESDFLTVNPYLGMESLTPFIESAKRHDKGLFVLVKTSNPGSSDFQDLHVSLTGEQEDKLTSYGVKVENGKSMLCNLIALKVRELADQNLNGSYSCVGVVAGATHPVHLKQLRSILKTSFFLVPGFGAQGASASDIKDCFNEDGLGAIVNSSRGILYAYEKSNDPENFEKHALDALQKMNSEINAII